VPSFLTTRELAARYRRSHRTIQDWRLNGYGPRGVRVNGQVLYELSEVERFERELDVVDPAQPPAFRPGAGAA
jgi:hypothetical protein